MTDTLLGKLNLLIYPIVYFRAHFPNLPFTKRVKYHIHLFDLSNLRNEINELIYLIDLSRIDTMELSCLCAGGVDPRGFEAYIPHNMLSSRDDAELPCFNPADYKALGEATWHAAAWESILKPVGK